MERILHVEDEEDIREVARVALEAIGGFTVESVESGRAALERVGPFAPQVILLDVMMPVMDGPMTLRELRNRPETANVPVIFMTAKVQAHEIEQYLKMGALDVIPKPFDPMQVSEQIRRIWSARTPA